MRVIIIMMNFRTVNLGAVNSNMMNLMKFAFMTFFLISSYPALASAAPADTNPEANPSLKIAPASDTIPPSLGINSPNNGPIQPGLIAYWDFNENNGTTAYDSSGNGYTGTINGAAWTSGKLGSALKFDGLNDYVRVANNIPSGSAGTVMAWIAPDSYSEGQAVTAGGDNTGNDLSARFQIITKRTTACSSGDWYAKIGNDVSYQIICSGQKYDSTNFPLGVWTQLAVTYNGSSVKMYKDGVLIRDAVQKVSAAGSAQPFSTGRLGAYDVWYFKGAIDEVRMYNRATTAEEIYEAYLKGSNSSNTTPTPTPAPAPTSSDITPPSIAINSPSNGQAFTSSTITVSGSASDDIGLSKVEVKAGTGTWQLASGTTSWSKALTLASGTNTIYVRATDTSGNIRETSVTVTYNSIQSDLIAYLNFDEGTGTIASDSSDNGNNGIINGATWTTGKLGSALKFDGVNDYVDLGSGASLKPGNITIMAWVYPQDQSSKQMIYEAGHSYSNNQGVSLGMNFNTFGFYKRFNAEFGNGAQLTFANQNADYVPNRWYHIATTYDSSQLKLYVDGVLKDNINLNGPISYSSFPARIGSTSWSVSNIFNGTIDEVKVYNRSLIAEEIYAEYSLTPTPVPTPTPTPTPAPIPTPDTTPPSIAINSPTNDQTFTTSSITVSGIASDNLGLSKVEVKVGTGTWQLVSGTASWSKTVNLASGSNTIYARATDTSGNIKDASVIATYTPQTAGKIYYVAKNGNDANPGTETQPWLTITKAANTLVAGDTVYVRSGTYNEFVIPANSGTAGNYITYMNYSGENPIIDGTGLGFSHSGLVSIISKSYIKFHGFTVRNYRPGVNWAYGFFVQHSHHVTLEYNTINNMDSSGIMFYQNQYNTVYKEGDEDAVAQYNNLYGNNQNGYEEGLDAVFTNNYVFRYNTVHDQYKDLIDSKQGSSYGRIHHNIAFGTHRDPTHGGGVGIYVAPYNYDARDIIVYDNIVYDADVCYTVDTEGGADFYDVRVYNNIAYECGTGYTMAAWGDVGSLNNVTFINNVAYKNINRGMYVANIPIYNSVIRNNIFSNNPNQMLLQTTSGLTVDYNLFYGSSSNYGSNYVIGDPKFVDATSNDFHLLSTSPATDKGSPTAAPSFDFDGNSRPRGNGYDIGAFEYLYQ